MYSAAIAEQLRLRGFDVTAVTERPELRSLKDPQLFYEAQAQGRAIVTENVDDYTVLVNSLAIRGVEHFGIVFVDSAKYPRGNARTIGKLVMALAKLASQ